MKSARNTKCPISSRSKAAGLLIVSGAVLAVAAPAPVIGLAHAGEPLASEREALVAIYTKTNGPAWKYQENWLSPTVSICEWSGVSCNSQGRVQYLSFEGLGLVGALPAEIGDLTQLLWLLVQDNSLTSLPESIGNLTQLDWLDVSFNRLATLPESIGSLKRLRQLQLDYNPLGVFPESLGGLTELDSLSMFGTQLTTLSPTVGKLTKLRFLSLADNSLTTLPDSIGDLSQVHRLDVSYNHLTSLPAAIGNMAQLTILDLRRNPSLTTVPAAIGNCSNLSFVYLSGTAVERLPAYACAKIKLPKSGVASTIDPASVCMNYGDVNKDGLVNIVDAMLVAQHAAGMAPTNFDASVADVNEDGSVNVVDAHLIAKYSADLVPDLPCDLAGRAP